MYKIGIIGCGAISTIITKHVIDNLKKKAEITSICDCDKIQMENFCKKFSNSCFQLFSSYKDIIPKVDIVIETASLNISFDIAVSALKQNKNVIILSVGGLLDKYDEIKKISKGNLYIPSGAIAGIDAIFAGSFGKIYSIELISKKHPKGFENTPYVIEKKIDLNKISDKDFVLFKGNASNAIKAFPKNINVSALLSIAGLGKEDTKVKIITSTKYKNNIHEIIVKGDFGEIKTITNNKVCPSNPKTSYLAGLSACAVISKICSQIKIGT